MELDFQKIDKNWQSYWKEKEVFKASNQSDKPKYYVLDMFPYPSGAGLHVGHPLGYIASDIYARFKRHKGFNVLHPMGFDAFGLPAEQYAIQTGQHPAITTQDNLTRYKAQMNQLGFSFDWSREVQTCDPNYYRWTQWIFLQLFNAWYDEAQNKARPIQDLIEHFEAHGTQGLRASQGEEIHFSAEEWKAFSEAEKAERLLNFRLAYRSESMVNWCPALGTVLANDEVKDGLSERGGHPVIQKKMMQWSLRISAYAQRLLDGLNEIDWSDALKESQKNWIGRSEGASVQFQIKGHDKKLEIFTTRPDTIFGSSFMVMAPEHPWVGEITSEAQKKEVEAYQTEAAKRSERDRMADTKSVTGAFTGAYASHPFTGKEIPIYIADYVLANYGTGAVMAVPGHDSRDYAFARKFDLPILEVVEGGNLEEAAYEAKSGNLVNSDFISGMKVEEGIQKVIQELEKRNLGKGEINYRLRDAVFGRQRYWGEPIPIYFENGIPKPVKDSHLPLELPEVDKYLPTEDGEPPLARAEKWYYHPDKGLVNQEEGFPLETTTMPGWAGSSWYWLRYMDAGNSDEFLNPEIESYWNSVDLYIGGAEHATGHLLYSRFWQKALKDLGFLSAEEPFKKLVNQGMIQGQSSFVYRLKNENTFVSHGLIDKYETIAIHADVSMVHQDVLDLEAFKAWREDFKDAKFILEDGKYICGSEVEKMSKSKFNVVTPDEIIEKFGADTLRMYEMFLGPLEQHKPWNTHGITGVHGFLKKFWKLYFDEKGLRVQNSKPSKEALKALHTLLKKVNEDFENLSFNTSVSAFMICVNELSKLKIDSREILEPLVVALSPFAPHISEEIWKNLGHDGGISFEAYPQAEEAFLIESSHEYPVSFNGKMRFKKSFGLDLSKDEIEKAILVDEQSQKYLEGKTPKKVIVVPKRIINIVV